VNSTGGSAKVVAHGTSELSNSTVANDFGFENTTGDINFSGKTTATTGGVNILASNGDMHALSAGPHVVAGAKSFLSTPKGTMGLVGDPIDVNVTGALTLDVGGISGGVSAKLTGTINDPAPGSKPLLVPSTKAPLYPAGDILFNGTKIWPMASGFMLTQQATGLIPRFLLPTGEKLNAGQVNFMDVASSNLNSPVYFYHPLSLVDSDAVNGFNLEQEAYDFIDGQIQPQNDDLRKKLLKNS
jgi:hypothetical protein